jgi:hypothetical protein
MRDCSYQLLAFGEFLGHQRISDLAVLPEWIDPYVAQIPCSDGHRRKLRLAMLRFIRFLRQKQVIPAPEQAPSPSPHMHFVEDYLQRLQELRGLCRNSLMSKRLPCQALLTFIGWHRALPEITRRCYDKSAQIYP